jgi:hypothetical protein
MLLLFHTYLALILTFVFFIRSQQEIAEASNDAARKYYEKILEAKRTGLGVTAVMRAAAKAK